MLSGSLNENKEDDVKKALKIMIDERLIDDPY
jgi:hypothetical protein